MKIKTAVKFNPSPAPRRASPLLRWLPLKGGAAFCRPLMAALCLLLTGCGIFGASEEELLYREGATKPVEVPEGVDPPDFRDPWPIPEVDDYRGLGDTTLEVGPPDALSTRFDIEQIIIRKLGTQQWVFIDMPPARVWPDLLSYWEARNLPLAVQEADKGVLESQWLRAAGEDADALVASAGQLDARARAEADGHKFRVRLEPGIRTGSTELYVDHKQLPTGAPFRLDELDWAAGSDDLEVEAAMLKALAFHLGEATAQGDRAVSMMAAGLKDQGKAVLEPGPDGLELRYRLDFDRAWATVGAALENANVQVEDLDRSQGNYYVTYTSAHEPEPGFFRNLFGGGDDEGLDNRFRVHLETLADQVRVTATLDKDPARTSEDKRILLLSERLLKLIREFST